MPRCFRRSPEGRGKVIFQSRRIWWSSRQVEAEWMAFVLVEVTDNVLKSARRLVERYPLRGFDAIHVASALGLRKELGVELTFVAADRRQIEAARAEGLTVVNVEAKHH